MDFLGEKYKIPKMISQSLYSNTIGIVGNKKNYCNSIEDHVVDPDSNIEVVTL